MRLDLLECYIPPSLPLSLSFLSRGLSVSKVKTLKHLTGVCDGSMTDDWQPQAEMMEPTCRHPPNSFLRVVFDLLVMTWSQFRRGLSCLSVQLTLLWPPLEGCTAGLVLKAYSSVIIAPFIFLKRSQSQKVMCNYHLQLHFWWKCSCHFALETNKKSLVWIFKFKLLSNDLHTFMHAPQTSAGQM